MCCPPVHQKCLHPVLMKTFRKPQNTKPGYNVLFLQFV